MKALDSSEPNCYIRRRRDITLMFYTVDIQKKHNYVVCTINVNRMRCCHSSYPKIITNR